MIKSEWKYLIDHKMMLVVLVAIALIPAIYCFIYLSSMWNTYGKMDKLPVAIVNHDESVTYRGNRISIGKTLTAKMTGSKSLDFHHVSSSTASEKLRAGKYYMVLTVPRNFSKRATTILSNHPKQMNLHFTFNSGQNFIASKMTNGAATAIKAKVSAQVTDLYSRIVLNALDEATKGMQAAAHGSKKVLNGSRKLATGENSLLAGERSLNAGTGTMILGTSALRGGTSKIIQGSTQIARKLTAGVEQLKVIYTDKRNAAAIANPVHERTTDISKVPNNGTGMAPFAIAIGLYVGAIALGTMYEGFLPHRKPKYAFSWWASKASIIGSVGLIQTVVLFGSLTTGNHLKVENMGMLFLILLLGSLLFLSLIFCLRLLLGGFGTWLVSIVLVLQLAASGGLYPTYLTNSFAQSLNVWLPMTYLIDALRSVISTHQAIGVNLIVMIILIIVFNLGMILRYRLGLHQSFIEIEENPEPE